MLKADIMEAYPLFQQLDPEILNKIISTIVIFEYPSDQLLFNQNECQGFALVLKGRLRIQYLSNRGREITMYRIGRGDYCHLTILRLLFHKDVQFEVYSENKVKIAVIPGSVFMQTLSGQSAFLKDMYLNLHKKMDALYSVINNVSFESVEERLISYLSQRARDEGSKVLTLTHEQIAVDIGATREAVTRTLGKMQDGGFVHLSRKKVEWLGEY